ncbi:helix-turn-helix domain-containing protein [Klenkia brasiliensis]|uniref:AraC-type DNA-binding protein n=1 Tax=Klenkia brasiliensis TaxID=333142 RepID=A0A1G8AAM2_9ACTN|nr:AraC family transcriptional regulator [Klenkia brasiliensis]SDH17982.1 AraC-type DNA-binding protein [Klenkia brasiliensis]
MTVEAGRIALDAGRGGRVEAGPGECVLYPHDRSADVQWDDLVLLPVRLPQQEVAVLAAADTGLPEEAFRFLSARPLSPQLGQLWVHTTGHLRDQLLLSPGESVNPFVHRGLVVAAAAAAFQVFPNTAMTCDYVPDAGDVRPAAVRRAVAFIDAHLSLPITISDAADAARTTPYALRAGLRRHLGTTFSAYLRRARCDATRHDLARAADVDAAVLGDVATRWGFADATQLRAALGGHDGNS